MMHVVEYLLRMAPVGVLNEPLNLIGAPPPNGDPRRDWGCGARASWSR